VGSDYSIAITEPVIFFDGVCNLCNGAVKTVIRFDKKGKFKFASLQSRFACYTFGEDPLSTFNTLILLKSNQLFFKSNAIIEIANELSGIGKCAVVLKIFPRVLRDFFYDIVAKHRYTFFGKSNSCIVPSQALMARFID
jgi:predicted DCC family thiol-disulfide oxidoreductase YuxK